MQRKPLDVQTFKNIIKPYEELTFGDSSPVSVISMPPTGQFTAWHGVIPQFVVRGSVCGTIYVCRTDTSDTELLNFDVYSVCEGNDTSTLLVNQVKPHDVEFHRTDELPEFMARKAPEDIKNKINNLK